MMHAKAVGTEGPDFYYPQNNVLMLYQGWEELEEYSNKEGRFRLGLILQQ